MEMNRTELAAVDGVACDLLDAQGRLVVTPNALTLDGQRNVPADLRPGETLEAFLGRHVPGIESGAWTVMIGGATVPRKMWSRTWPKHGQLIACRASVGKQVVAIVAIAVLSYFTMGAGATLGGSLLGINGLAMVGAAGLAAVNMGIFIAGSALINKVLGPKVPKPGEAAAARQIYSLSSQRNTARAYEPLPVLWGEMRVTPDLASQPYTWFEGDDQYLGTILLGGVNVYSAADLAIGDTSVTSYSDVGVYYNGFSGMASQDIPLYGNADAVAGAELEPNGPWITRTSSAGAMALQLDIEGQLFDTDNKGGTQTNSVPLHIETRLVGVGAWQAALSVTLTNASTEVLRRTYTLPVVLGQHEVRVRLGQPTYNEGAGKDACKLAWNVLKSIQPDATDYSAWGRIGIKIKATGQLSGGLDTLRATYRARPIPLWNGVAWVTASTREEGLSNPGAILLQTLRGVYASGVLQFGFGMQDEQIDIEGLKAFMLHCTANGYTYDRWLTGSMSLGQFCQEVALAGMGEFSWTDGSRPTAVFVGSGQPLSGVVNMANMLKGSFSVAYNLSNAADGIEYQYLDRDRNWETQTLRVAAPGVTTMLNPARITGEGVTTEAHAAVLARYHLAQSLYQYKTIDFGADIEHLAYRRLSVLSISHDLTQWGYGGRVMRAERLAGKVVLQLDEPVPAFAQAYVGLRVPGARDYRVFKVQPLQDQSDQITLVEAWPAGVKFPGEDLDNPAHDTLWCYDFKATPGYRVRVVGMEPEADLKGAKVSCVPEGPEFWDYVLNGTYTPAPNQSSLPQLGRPTVANLRISEQVNVQGDTEWYALHAVWDAGGDYDHAQVWAGRDGSELRLVDGNAVGSRSTFRIDGAGEWLVEVRPFNASGLVGQSATVLYITTMTQIAPRNVDDFVVQEVAGGLRRFAWQYTGDRPPAFAGVQIRYLPGDVVLSVADWDGMQPLGEADDVYRAQFETTRPQAGQWTFGCRAIDTAGQLANGVVRFVANLGDSFEQVQQPDLTPPPAVTGLAAAGMLSTVQVSWDVPLYTEGHGHARTEVWASLTAARADAQKLAEGYAGPVSFSAEPAQVWHIWARNVSSDGVPGEWAGPVTAETGTDVAGLLDVLDGQLGRDQFSPIVVDRLDVIDRIDQDGGPLGKSLLTAAVHQDTLNQQVRGNMEDMAKGLLEAALAADAALERITDAGVYVDPATGAVKIYGLEVTKGQVTNLQVLLDALNGQLQLKATTTYVDGKIAQAVLSPADLLLYEGLDARMVEVVQQLDSINGTLSSKASALELQQALVRLTTAESNLDALNGQIALRVTRAEYQADQDAVQQRLGSAELTLSALDVPAITATVTAVSRNERDAEKTAEALLRDILTGERDRVQGADALAFARNQLSAAIQEGLAAEARQRLELAVVVGGQTSALQREELVRAQADEAEAQARLQLASRVDGDVQSLSAAITEESRTRATAIAAEATRRELLAAAVDDNHAAVEQGFSAQAGVNGYLAAKYSLAVQVGQGGQLVIGGMQITGSSEGGAGPKIATAFATDAFSIVAPDGTKKTTPFYVQTSDMTINGVVVPAGAYMDSARIGNVEAILGRFGTLFADKVQATELSASQLTAGNGVIGGLLKSSNYMAGSSGWVLRPDGVAEFSGVIVRGTIYATAGTIGAFSISANGLNSGGFTSYAWPAGTATGVHVSPSGILIGNPSTGRYLELNRNGDISGPQFSIINGVAKFSGDLVAARGTFAGSLTAGAINAVNTINIAGDAVTVPTGATSSMGGVAAVVVRMTTPGRIMVIGNASWLAENGSAASAWVRVVCSGIAAGMQTGVSLAPGYSGSATAMGLFDVGVGDYYCYVETGNTGQRAPGPQGIVAIGVKR